MELIFTNFWTWLGTVILAATVLDGAAGVIKAARKPQRSVKRTVSKEGGVTVEITGATEWDVRRAVEAMQPEKEPFRELPDLEERL